MAEVTVREGGRMFDPSKNFAEGGTIGGADPR